MVHQDFNPNLQKPKSQYRIPPIGDRLLAFVFDLVIFSPVFSFILASLFRKLELMYFISPHSVEFLILCAVSFVFTAMLIVLFQTLFLMLLGATPGKYFFKIQVVSLHGKLRFSQAILRSFLWMLEAICFFLPFLEILSESHRRPLHDRAAGTMAVTLKKTGDEGPFPYETQFVRQFLVLVSFCFLAWGVYFVGHFYHLAVRGEFKKSELEAEDFLCASVSNSLEDSEIRLDKAIAMYLADEISDECLAAEAEFALWIPDESQRPWAYLAKAFLKKHDFDLYEAYLEKTCETDESGLACSIAKYQADPKNHSIPEESQTSQILRITQNFERGLYQESVKDFMELGKLSGFSDFAQGGLVKALWAQNRKERAQGAYQNVVNQMGRRQNIELSAWICHEQLDSNCSHEAIEACDHLKATLKDGKSQIQESFVALALIREKECRQTADFDYSRFKKLLKEKVDVLQFVHGISSSSPMNPTAKASALEDLAFRKASVKPAFVRRMALHYWVHHHMTSDADFQKAVHYLKEKKVQDLSWVKVYTKTLQVLLQSKSQQHLKEIVDLPSPEVIATHRLEVAQIQAHYLLQNYDKVQAGLRSLWPSSRAPASTNHSNLSLESIRQEMAKRGAQQ